MTTKSKITAGFLGLVLGVHTLSANASTQLTQVQLVKFPDYTRVVFSLSEPDKYHVFALANPNRVVVDMQNAHLKADVHHFDFSQSKITGVRTGNPKSGTLRVVFDMGGRSHFNSSFVPEGHGHAAQLVVDIYPADKVLNTLPSEIPVVPVKVAPLKVEPKLKPLVVMPVATPKTELKNLVLPRPELKPVDIKKITPPKAGLKPLEQKKVVPPKVEAKPIEVKKASAPKVEFIPLEDEIVTVKPVEEKKIILPKAEMKPLEEKKIILPKAEMKPVQEKKVLPSKLEMKPIEEKKIMPPRAVIKPLEEKKILLPKMPAKSVETKKIAPSALPLDIEKITPPPKVDLKPQPPVKTLEPPKLPDVLPKTLPAPDLQDTSLLTKPRTIVVVIDAGHGGKDPGTIGVNGGKEKDIVLGIALRMAGLVNKEPNMHAVLTRNGDYFVTLRDRLRIARKNKADFFVSIHADAYHTDKSTGGVSIYALSRHGATTEAARWLAQRENYSGLGGVDFGELGDKSYVLRSVLIDLSQTATITDSVRLGRNILHEMEDVTKLHDPNVEQAPFVVLKSPDIPSVLIESGYLSNPQDEDRLRNPVYREQLASALLAGIHRYLKYHPVTGV